MKTSNFSLNNLKGNLKLIGIIMLSYKGNVVLYSTHTGKVVFLSFYSLFRVS